MSRYPSHVLRAFVKTHFDSLVPGDMDSRLAEVAREVFEDTFTDRDDAADFLAAMQELADDYVAAHMRGDKR